MSFKSASPARNSGTISGRAPAAPVASPAAAADGAKVYPTHTLSAKATKEGELTKLTGLFANESKNGKRYLSVTLKEGINLPAGTTLMLFENDAKN